jgi:AraC-like DNA-binding protein
MRAWPRSSLPKAKLSRGLDCRCVCIPVADFVDEAAFLAAPVGHLVGGRSFVYGAVAIPSGVFHFTLLSGTPDANDVEALARVWEVECTQAHRLSIFDASQIAAVDNTAYAAVTGVLAALYPRTIVARQAVIRPSGMAGALVAGHQHLQPPPFPLQIFDNRAAGLEWLGLPLDILDGIEPPGDEIVTRLRAALETNLAASLIEIAAQLALSERSLQRRLGAAHTSFARELAAAQIRRASRLLDETDRKLADIAGEVGLSSAGALIELFRRHTGLTPQKWRERRDS